MKLSFRAVKQNWCPWNLPGSRLSGRRVESGHLYARHWGWGKKKKSIHNRLAEEIQAFIPR